MTSVYKNGGEEVVWFTRLGIYSILGTSCSCSCNSSQMYHDMTAHTYICTFVCKTGMCIQNVSTYVRTYAVLYSAVMLYCKMYSLQVNFTCRKHYFGSSASSCKISALAVLELVSETEQSVWEWE